jgi:hypothetical protein
VAFAYNKPRNVLELALQQEGCAAAANAAMNAMDAGGKKGFGGSLKVRDIPSHGPTAAESLFLENMPVHGVDGCQCPPFRRVQVAVMELDGNAQEKPLSLTRDAYQHVDIACKTRPGQKVGSALRCEGRARGCRASPSRRDSKSHRPPVGPNQATPFAWRTFATSVPINAGRCLHFFPHPPSDVFGGRCVYYVSR